MHDFALVSEGITDHAILKNILLGYFQQQREPEIHREFPDPQAKKHYGGWTLVLKYLREKKFRQAFQLNRFLIVQVDTDVAEDAGFDVPRQNQNGPIPLVEFIANVVIRLRNEIGEPDWEVYASRFIFAVGVNQLECWLLPLWFNDAGGKQIANCTNRLNKCPQLRDALDSKNYPWIHPEKKDFRSYALASGAYRRRATLETEGRRNPSLGVFLDELNRREIVLQPIE